MTTTGERTASPIAPPHDARLPFFAYGALKPGEPAHHRIKRFLAKAPVSATANGALWVRDGLPLLKIDENGTVHGFLLHFTKETAARAYEVICRFEPRNHYCWAECVILRESTNVLVGRQMSRGRPAQLDDDSWTSRDDPVFRHGLTVVREAIKSDATRPFTSAPPSSFDWPRFFRLQMAYMLVWSAIERYTALLLGAGLDPMARIKQFGNHDVFRSAFKEARVSRTDEVCDSRDPRVSLLLTRADPSSSLLYYYQVRNNLSHRGKGAWSDGEIVRKSLLELEEILAAVLRQGA